MLRSRALKTLGFTPLAVIGATQVIPSVAEAAVNTSASTFVPAALSGSQGSKLAALSTSQLAALTAPGGKAPAATTIDKMLDPEDAAKLTAAAKALTKADLVGLGNGGLTAADKALSVADVASIKAAFAGPGATKAAALSFSACCCCTPCCCAAAQH